jgi:chemotaxis signal transduction protein
MTENANDVDPMQYLVFVVGRFRLAIEVTEAIEIIRPLKKPDYFSIFAENEIVFHGKRILLVRLGVDLFNVPAYPVDDYRIIIVSADGKMMGLVVDAVEEIVHISGENFTMIPEHFTDINSDYLKGVISEDNPIYILNTNPIYAHARDGYH